MCATADCSGLASLTQEGLADATTLCVLGLEPCSLTADWVIFGSEGAETEVFWVPHLRSEWTCPIDYEVDMRGRSRCQLKLRTLNEELLPLEVSCDLLGQKNVLWRVNVMLGADPSSVGAVLELALCCKLRGDTPWLVSRAADYDSYETLETRSPPRVRSYRIKPELDRLSLPPLPESLRQCSVWVPFAGHDITCGHSCVLLFHLDHLIFKLEEAEKGCKKLDFEPRMKVAIGFGHDEITTLPVAVDLDLKGPQTIYSSVYHEFPRTNALNLRFILMEATTCKPIAAANSDLSCFLFSGCDNFYGSVEFQWKACGNKFGMVLFQLEKRGGTQHH